MKKSLPRVAHSYDDTFRFVLDIDPDLEQWRILASEWVKNLARGKAPAMRLVRIFLIDYIYGHKLTKEPAEFLRIGYKAPCFYSSCLGHLESSRYARSQYSQLLKFIDYVLKHYFSGEDDRGVLVVSPAFRNPIPSLPVAENTVASQRVESNKNALPFRFIARLKAILCPVGETSFSGWKWAQSAENCRYNGGGWFTVTENIIDRADPDCVWRERQASVYERRKFGYGESIYQMWSPARAVALYVKLQLPLRTFQVLMLDSGEADTLRYVQGKWVRNTGCLAEGSDRSPLRRGVFRKMSDDLTKETMTGLFINTNKTADLMKDEWSKGYNLPWEHREVLYWLERLRNWQEKYNPVFSPIPWTDLSVHQLGSPKSTISLRMMGKTCFLFRDAASAVAANRSKPICVNGPINVIWYNLLKTLEDECDAKNERDIAGNKLFFVPAKRRAARYYPLHALRVSLITAYALEGGVPMTILSRCIAGHSRLLMTLYYTKIGITYCSELMDKATRKLLLNEQDNYARWLKDKTYEQVEANGAFCDPAAVHALMQAMHGGVSLVKDDKGFCPKGGWGCDSGGIYINDDTGGVNYGEVPGYPQKNCVRCRWFFTGYAFRHGIENHWNNIQLQMGDVGERIVNLGGQITNLEDDQFECQRNDQPFLESDKLESLRKVYQAEIEKNNKLALDLSATYRLMVRCLALEKLRPQGDGLTLITVGDQSNASIAISECSKLQQILTAVAGSRVFPEHDVRKAALQAGKAFDEMLANNRIKPIFFRVREDELPRVVTEMTELITAEAGSVRDAVPFIEGKRQLAELGLDEDIEKLAQQMASGPIIRSNPLRPRQINDQRRLSFPTSDCKKEASSV
jgi:hypothetical protein